MTNKIYAGIGSRETPSNIRDLMEEIAYRSALQGWTLRSGGADGADTAFEFGCIAVDGPKEIYLPWRGFGGRRPVGHGYYHGVSNEALDMAAQFHPAWQRCSSHAQILHARNCYQVLGLNLRTPCFKVICWTKGAAGGGGTGQALRIAKAYNILIHDLADKQVEAAYRVALEKYK